MTGINTCITQERLINEVQGGPFSASLLFCQLLAPVLTSIVQLFFLIPSPYVWATGMCLLPLWVGRASHLHLSNQRRFRSYQVVSLLRVMWQWQCHKLGAFGKTAAASVSFDNRNASWNLNLDISITQRKLCSHKRFSHHLKFQTAAYNTVEPISHSHNGLL